MRSRPAVLVGERRIHHERERREAVHVEGDAREPPGNGLVATEECAGVLLAAGEIYAHPDHRDEERGDDGVVDKCETLVFHAG